MRSLGCLPLAFVFASLALAQEHRAADLGKAILSAGLDSNECYRIRDLQFSQEDAQFFLTDGYLMFGKPVNGRPLSAVFSADAEGGDAEVLLLPPDRSERKSLALHTGAPNLNEHFRAAIFFFTDSTAKTLLDQITANGARRSSDIGALLSERWAPIVKNISGSFESRLVLDLMTPGLSGHGFFGAVVSGDKVGNFDVVRDDRAYEQVIAGQASEKNGVSVWDTWTSFTSRSHRGQLAFQPEIKITSYRIEAEITSELDLKDTVHIRLQTTEASREVIPFDLTGRMRALEAKIDGVPVEVYERDSVRNGMIQNSGNELVLLVPSKPLLPNTEHDIEIRLEGKVVESAGKKIYFVGSRGTWYPDRGLQFASFDSTFRYPAGLQLVTAGEVKEDRTEGAVRITRRVANGNVRLLGVNLGEYERRQVVRSGITVEAFANRAVEEGLRSRPIVVARENESLSSRTRRPGAAETMVIVPPTPSPVDALDRIAGDIAAAAVWFEARFGPPPLRQLEVSPVIGRFGQGYPGMIYLSTLSYFDSGSRQLAALPKTSQFFFTDLMRVHEVAHQWWGNTVVAATYHHEWLMEALANYSALLYEESTQGKKVLDDMLDQYRKDLLIKNQDGELADSAGPVVQGRRLEMMQNPAAFPAVVYGKGTWIVHMLRRQMGDAQFLKMLAELRRTYEWKTIDTEQFRVLAASYLPPGSKDKTLENFFDQWVYSTGMPALKMTFSVKGKPGAYKLAGTVTQSEVPDDFSVIVPVEVQTGRGKSVTVQVRTGPEPAPFSVPVAAANAKAVLDPQNAVLKR